MLEWWISLPTQYLLESPSCLFRFYWQKFTKVYVYSEQSRRPEDWRLSNIGCPHSSPYLDELYDFIIRANILEDLKKSFASSIRFFVINSRSMRVHLNTYLSMKKALLTCTLWTYVCSKFYMLLNVKKTTQYWRSKHSVKLL